jgi:hypothetical protein
MPGIVEPQDEPVSKYLWDLHIYWRSKRGGAFAPAWSAIGVAEMRPWLNYLALVDVVGEEPRFRCRLFSTALVRAYGADITGRWMDECDLNFVLFVLIAQMARVVSEKRPNTLRARFTKNTDGRYLDYERMALPLSDDGEHVNMILCGYRIYEAGAT